MAFFSEVSVCLSQRIITWFILINTYLIKQFFHVINKAFVCLIKQSLKSTLLKTCTPGTNENQMFRCTCSTHVTLMLQ